MTSMKSKTIISLSASISTYSNHLANLNSTNKTNTLPKSIEVGSKGTSVHKMRCNEYKIETTHRLVGILQIIEMGAITIKIRQTHFPIKKL